MTDWVRLWHDMPTDPKWRVIARKSGQPLPCVIAVFTLMLTNASGNAADRGCLLAWDDEDAGAALDMDAADVAAIRSAMQGKVLEGERLTGWERRQPKREDSGVGARVAKHRLTHGNAVKRNVTQRNASETDTDTDTEDSVSNETAAVEPEPVDPEKIMFTAGVALLREAGKSESAARSWLGKAKRDHGAEHVITMIARAKREGAVDPIAFIEGGLRAAVRARASPEMPVC